MHICYLCLVTCYHMIPVQVLSTTCDEGLLQDPSLLEGDSRESRDSGIGEQLDDAMSELQKQEERRRREEEARWAVLVIATFIWQGGDENQAGRHVGH